MIFDDYFYTLTGGRGVDGNLVDISSDTDAGDNEPDSVFGLKPVGDAAKDDNVFEAAQTHIEPETPAVKREFTKDDFVIESDLVIPKTNLADRKGTKPVILVIDDDFPTLDLLKVYLSRDFEFYGFSSAKEGLFFLNQNIVDLILFDCRIHTTRSDKVVTIIRQYRHCKDVPIIYVGDDAELFQIRESLPEGVNGTLRRPVARADLQKILDEFIKKD